MMRRQYHFRPSPRGLKAWNVHRLIELTKDRPRLLVPLGAIRELDEPYWFSAGAQDATCRAVLEHARAIEEADLSYPIILSADGRVMDGMHRVAKAVMMRLESIEAVQFEQDPEPDHVGVLPEELPYDENDAAQQPGEFP